MRKNNKILNKKEFSKAIEMLPLISIDFCLIYKQKILLGKRNNEPAKDFLFTPGGRIRKNEPYLNAFERIFFDELNTALVYQDKLRLMGIWDHFYDKSAFDKNISTFTMSNLADQLSTNYGLARSSENFLTGINGVKFTNNVLMETDDSCSFRFNVDDCDDANCEMVKNPANIFGKFPNSSKFTFQVQGTLNDTFMFPIPGSRTYIMKTNGDDTGQVADFFY